MKFKCIIAVVILFFFVAAVPMSGQSGDKTVNYKGTHEVELSIGLPTVQSPMLVYAMVEGIGLILSSGMSAIIVGDTTPVPVEYMGEGSVKIPVFRAEYGYNINNWFNIGCGVYYNYERNPMRYIETKQFAWDEKENVVSFMLNTKFYWLNRGIVRMYSGVSVGFGLVNTNMESILERNNAEMETAVMPAFDLRLIGLTVGKKLYGRFELGALCSGVVTAGIGYRF